MLQKHLPTVIGSVLGCNAMRNDSKELSAPAGLVVRAGAYLVANGYGRMALLPYVSSSGAWRCEFHVLGHPSRVLFRYSIGSRNHFLADHGDLEAMSDVAVEGLAQAIIGVASLEVLDQCRGAATREYTAWLKLLDGHISRGLVPLAFHEFSEPDDPWSVMLPNGDGAMLSIAAPPMYVRPQDEPTV